MFDRIKILISDIWHVIQPSLTMFLTGIGRAALQTALTVVKDAMGNPDLKTGADRRDYAVARMKSELNAAPERLINLAIEMAVNKIDPK
jgi:hypothetical protein